MQVTWSSFDNTVDVTKVWSYILGCRRWGRGGWVRHPEGWAQRRPTRAFGRRVRRPVVQPWLLVSFGGERLLMKGGRSTTKREQRDKESHTERHRQVHPKTHVTRVLLPMRSERKNVRTVDVVCCCCQHLLKKLTDDKNSSSKREERDICS